MAIVKIGNAGSIEVDTAKFNDEVNAHIFNYGLKQILNDTRIGGEGCRQGNGVGREETRRVVRWQGPRRR
jgi:hypothetical protein